MGRIVICVVSLRGEVLVTPAWLSNVPTPQSCLGRKETHIVLAASAMMTSLGRSQNSPSPLTRLLRVTTHRLACRDHRS